METMTIDNTIEWLQERLDNTEKLVSALNKDRPELQLFDITDDKRGLLLLTEMHKLTTELHEKVRDFTCALVDDSLVPQRQIALSTGLSTNTITRWIHNKEKD